MSRRGFEQGRRPGQGRRSSSSRDQRRSDAARDRSNPDSSAPGQVRLLLTRLVREREIWNVYVTTTTQTGAPNRTQLEFEKAGSERGTARHTRPAVGPLMDALHNGTPVSRVILQDELERALVDAEAVPATG